jgi:putative ABC transport system permease protein
VEQASVMLFRLLSWPYLRRHVLRWTLTITGIVLGVGVFVAMHTASRSILLAFNKTVDQIAGATQLQVWAGEFGFDESILERVQGIREVGVAVPVIESTVQTAIPGQGTMLILGIDMTGDRSLREYDLDEADESVIDDPLVFLAQPDSLLVTTEFARQNGLGVNSRIPLLTVEGEKQFTVRGIMTAAAMTQAFGGNLAVMDIYAAQHVLGRGRRFDRIDLRVAEGVTVEQAQTAVHLALGPGFEVEPPSSRGRHFEALLQSYSTAMTISSLFALIVGMFIIYNSFSIAVTQRRSEIGILRALGATQSQVRRIFLMESGIAGFIGSAAGAAAGLAMGRGIASYLGALVEQVAGVAQRVDELAIDPMLLVIAMALGVGTSVFAAWIPARSAGRVSPVQALQKGKYQILSAGESRRRRQIAVVLLLLSVAALFFTKSKPAFYTGYISTIVAALLFAPTLTVFLSKALRPLLKVILPAEGTLAADSLVQTPRRTSATVSALMLSLAMVVAFGGFTHSMYDSMNEWMRTALNPDFFVTPTPNLTVRTITFPAEIGPLIQEIEGVDQVQLVRSARILYQQIPVMIVSVETAKLVQKVRRVPIAGDYDEMNRLAAEGKGLIVSDSFAQIHDVKLGNVVALPTPSGILSLPIAGIVRDYTDLQGTIFIDRAVYTKWWNDTAANVARVYIKQGEDARAVRQRVIDALAGNRRLIVMTNSEVREWVLKLVNQWFGMTYNQIAVAMLVAVLGIVNTLTVSITDRRRELGVMQAVGGLRHQIRRTIWLEALAIAAIGLILGICLGAINLYYTLGMVKRDVAGIDLDYIFPLTVVVAMIPTILMAAFAAAIGPAESAVRGHLVEALEYE